MADVRIGMCTECHEEDYLDFTATIDGKRYCQACYDEVYAKIETVKRCPTCGCDEGSEQHNSFRKGAAV